MVNVTKLSTPKLLARIAELQQIQKTHSTKTPAWQTASELLQPCFAEMARRQPHNSNAPDEPEGCGGDAVLDRMVS